VKRWKRRSASGVGAMCNPQCLLVQSCRPSPGGARGVGSTMGRGAGEGFPRRLAWSSRRRIPGQPEDHGEEGRGDVTEVTKGERGGWV
jgi:hypothetical protein